MQLVEGRPRFVCPGCQTVFYEHRKVSAGARIELDGKLLLVQRGFEPWKGYWHMPAGYVEVDEDPRRTAEREAFEETGFRVIAEHLIDTYIYNDDPRGNGIVLIYKAIILEGKPTPNTESVAVRFFSKEEIADLPLAGQSARDSIADWMKEIQV